MTFTIIFNYIKSKQRENIFSHITNLKMEQTGSETFLFRIKLNFCFSLSNLSVIDHKTTFYFYVIEKRRKFKYISPKLKYFI